MYSWLRTSLYSTQGGDPRSYPGWSPTPNWQFGPRLVCLKRLCTTSTGGKKSCFLSFTQMFMLRNILYCYSLEWTSYIFSLLILGHFHSEEKAAKISCDQYGLQDFEGIMSSVRSSLRNPVPLFNFHSAQHHRSHSESP